MTRTVWSLHRSIEPENLRVWSFGEGHGGNCFRIAAFGASKSISFTRAFGGTGLIISGLKSVYGILGRTTITIGRRRKLAEAPEEHTTPQIVHLINEIVGLQELMERTQE